MVKVCKCGCDGVINSTREKTFYLPGHQNKNKFVWRAEPSEIRFCACGCGQQIQWREKFKYYGWARFINQHSNNFRKGKIKTEFEGLEKERKENFIKEQKELIISQKRETLYKKNINEVHHCECGCNILIPFMNRYKYYGWPKYLYQHHMRISKEILYGGKEKNLEINKRIGLSLKGREKPEGFGEKARERQLGKTMQERLGLSDEQYKIFRNKQSIIASQPLEKRWKNSTPEQILEFKKKQAFARKGKTYKEVMGEDKALLASKKKSLACPHWGMSKYETPILDFLEGCLGYKIDRKFWVAIPNTNKRYKIDGYCHELKLAIEIDEHYHNYSTIQSRDMVRENEIASLLGCQFLRLPVEMRF